MNAADQVRVIAPLLGVGFDANSGARALTTATPELVRPGVMSRRLATAAWIELLPNEAEEFHKSWLYTVAAVTFSSIKRIQEKRAANKKGDKVNQASGMGTDNDLEQLLDGTFLRYTDPDLAPQDMPSAAEVEATLSALDSPFAALVMRIIAFLSEYGGQREAHKLMLDMINYARRKRWSISR